EHLGRREIGEDGALHASDVLREAFAAAQVVNHDFPAVCIFLTLAVVLLGTIERGERVVVPDVPADPLARRDRLRSRVHVAVRVIERFIPQALPSHDLGILGEQAPESDESAVSCWPRAVAPHRVAPFVQLEVSGFRALDVDTLLFRGGDAVLTEAGDTAARTEPSVIGADGVAERTLAFASPHQAVDVIRAQIILDHAEPEVARVRVARTGEWRGQSAQRCFARGVEAGNARADDVLEPADDFHTALARRR